MIFELRIQSEAILDIQDAYEWYEQQQSGLGAEFIEEVEVGFSKLRQHPFHYGTINAHLRRVKIDRFPYLIVFEIKESVVFITSLHHVRKEPKADQ